ncbi:MAG: cyclase family protein [Pseudomonadales bacterium]|nr:cyclase family protein [Pseudomonadales bacterium]
MATLNEHRKTENNGQSLLASFLLTCSMSLMTYSLSAEEPSKKISNESVFMDKLLEAEIIELNFIWDATSPLLPLNPPFLQSLSTTHRASAGFVPGGIAFASDVMFFSGQHGAPTIDALGHISHEGKLFGGIDALSAESPQGLRSGGIESYPREKLVNRGVLLDIPRYKGLERLKPGYEITPEDLQGTAESQGVEIMEGDSVLIRTGYGQLFMTDKAAYLGYRPGIGEASAIWLAGKNIFLSGADNLTYDVAPETGSIFPAHRILVAEHGIYLVENLNLESLASTLAERKLSEFVLVINPPRFRGATAFPVNVFVMIPPG